MNQRFDLLGDPIAENHGKPGANGHVPTAETTRKVRVLVLAGMPKYKIAEELGITPPTLAKHYFANGKISLNHAKEMARAEQRGRVLLQLDRAASEGKVSAMNAINKMLDEEDVKAAARRARGDDKPARDKPMAKERLTDER